MPKFAVIAETMGQIHGLYANSHPDYALGIELAFVALGGNLGNLPAAFKAASDAQIALMQGQNPAPKAAAAPAAPKAAKAAAAPAAPAAPKAAKAAAAPKDYGQFGQCRSYRFTPDKQGNPRRCGCAATAADGFCVTHKGSINTVDNVVVTTKPAAAAVETVPTAAAADKPVCAGTKKDGTPCTSPFLPVGSAFCKAHAAQATDAPKARTVKVQPTPKAAARNAFAARIARKAAARNA
jgi:hypothetical protein